MATPRQIKVAHALVENLQSPRPVSTGQVLKSVGYGTGLQNQPKRVLESDGVREELAIMGFDVDTARTVVSEILRSKYEEGPTRLKAADMVFKSFGAYAPEKHTNVNLNIAAEPGDVDLDALITKAEADLKAQKING